MLLVVDLMVIITAVFSLGLDPLNSINKTVPSQAILSPSRHKPSSMLKLDISSPSSRSNGPTFSPANQERYIMFYSDDSHLLWTQSTHVRWYLSRDLSLYNFVIYSRTQRSFRRKTFGFLHVGYPRYGILTHVAVLVRNEKETYGLGLQ